MEMNLEGVKGHKEVKVAAQKARPFSTYNPPGTSPTDGRERHRDQTLQEFEFYYNHSKKLLEGSRQRSP